MVFSIDICLTASLSERGRHSASHVAVLQHELQACVISDPLQSASLAVAILQWFHR
jgi:hypothetical protein